MGGDGTREREGRREGLKEDGKRQKQSGMGKERKRHGRRRDKRKGGEEGRIESTHPPRG